MGISADLKMVIISILADANFGNGHHSTNFDCSKLGQVKSVVMGKSFKVIKISFNLIKQS